MTIPLLCVSTDVPDPRIETANQLHQLIDILVIAGADDWQDIEAYGRSKEDFFRRFLELPNGIPSHDTFERVFAKLDPDAFADWEERHVRRTKKSPELQVFFCLKCREYLV